MGKFSFRIVFQNIIPFSLEILIYCFMPDPATLSRDYVCVYWLISDKSNLKLSINRVSVEFVNTRTIMSICSLDFSLVSYNSSAYLFLVKNYKKKVFLLSHWVNLFFCSMIDERTYYFPNWITASLVKRFCFSNLSLWH